MSLQGRMQDILKGGVTAEAAKSEKFFPSFIFEGRKRSCSI